jgi:hypothetical protein
MSATHPLRENTTSSSLAIVLYQPEEFASVPYDPEPPTNLSGRMAAGLLRIIRGTLEFFGSLGDHLASITTNAAHVAIQRVAVMHLQHSGISFRPVAELQDPNFEHEALSAFEAVRQRSTSAHSEPNIFCSARQQRFDALQSGDTELHIPEEYLCNLSTQIMDDPVKLPSGEICERVVITRVIEESGRNPYTRAPLSITDLESCGELSAQIESFLRRLERNQEDASSTTPGL